MRKQIAVTFFIVVLCGLLVTGQVVNAQIVPKITPEEFSRLCTSMSEYGGSFSSDNWVSNELTYLNVMEPIERYNIKGGVYIGVGANQNFTYIAAIKPDLVFNIDIRHQNRMQHLIFKIIFELAETPAEFVSLLISKPFDPKTGPRPGTPINEIVNYFSGYNSPGATSQMTDNTEKTIIDILTNKYKFDLTSRDRSAIHYVLSTFRSHGLNITYSGYQRSWYPTWAQLLTMRENGEMLNPFNNMDDYNFLRNMHLENRIIPLTGDFGGAKAIREVAEYLKFHNLTVTAYYVSNVEQYVFRDWSSWNSWVNNIKNLPITDRSVFIRWTHDGGYGNFQQTRLQWIKTFIENFDNGRYYTYEDVKYLDYIKQ